MTLIIAWLTATISVQGLLIPHWVLVFFGVGAITEYFLGRSKNPRLRSLAGIVMNGISFVVKKSHVTDIPKVGDVITKILDFVAPPPVNNCTRCGGTGIEPANPPKNA